MRLSDLINPREKRIQSRVLIEIGAIQVQRTPEVVHAGATEPCDASWLEARSVERSELQIAADLGLLRIGDDCFEG